MQKAKPGRAALLIAAAVVILGIGWIVLALSLKSTGMVSCPAETEKPLVKDERTEAAISPLVLASETVTGTNFTRVTDYRYDASGRLMQQRWENGVCIDFDYYENGNLKSEVKYNTENLLFTMEYREDGVLFQKTEYARYADGTLSSVETTQYDEKGTLLLYTNRDADGDYHSTIHYSNEYDAEGRLIRQEITRDDGTLLHVDLWNYQADGSYTLDSTEYNGDPNDNPVWRHEVHTYDESGNCLSIVWDISDMYPSQDRQTFAYDDQGNLTEEVWLMYPLGNEDYTRYLTEYENTYENGRLVKVEVFYSETSTYDGETTQTPRTASTVETWEYDEYGNLLFHDNGFTTYAYTYLPLEQVLFS